MLARVVNALLHALTNKTSRTLLVMLAALAIPFASPKLAALRVIRISRMQPREPAGAPESERGAEPATSAEVGEQALPSSENTPTINNSLSASSDSSLPDIDPRVRAALREIPIADPTGHALDAFVEHLARTERKEPGAVTRILHYGDSTIASDYISGTARRRLQARFGDSGHGFILIANPWEWYFHNDVFHASSGEWNASRLAGPWASDGLYGLGGVSFSSYGGGVAWFGTATHGDFGRRVERFDIYYLEQPGGGELEFAIHGGPIEKISTRGDSKISRVYSVRTTDGESKLRLRAAGGGPVRVFGVALERDESGVVYDALGSHAAMAIYWQRQNRAHWREQLKLRDPALVILQYGTNESEASTFDAREYERALGELVDEVIEVTQGASVLLVAPLDRATYKEGKLAVHPLIVDLVTIQRRVALAHGAAFWNTFEAMGGEGAMIAWVHARPELGGADLTHPTPLGAEVLGNMMANAMIRALETQKPR